MEKDDFLKKLEKLVAHAKSKHNTVDAGEINDFFVGDNLTPEQMDQIYSYLENRNIDVVPVLDEAMLNADPDATCPPAPVGHEDRQSLPPVRQFAVRQPSRG